MQPHHFKNSFQIYPSLLIVILLLIITSKVGVDARGYDTLITLQGAVDFAVNNGLSMRTAAIRHETAVASFSGARQALLPTARATLSTSRRQAFSSATGEFSAGASAGIDYEFSPARFLFLRAGQKNVGASMCDIDRERNDVVAATIIQYVRTISTGKLIEVQQENVDYQKRKLIEIDALFRQGIKAHADVLQQRSNLANAQVNLLKSIQTSQRTKFQLLYMLELPITADYRFDSTMVMTLQARFFTDTALRIGPTIRETDEIKAQRLRAESAAAALAGTRLAYIPAVSFSVGVSALGRNSLSLVNNSGGSSGTSNAFDFGASVGVPLFDQQQRWLKVRNAEITLETARLELERLLRAVNLSAQLAVLDDTMGTEIVTTSITRFESADEALQAMDGRYRAGVATLTDLNAVQSSYAEAGSALVQARFDRIINRISLFNETGRLDRVIAIVKNGRSEER